MTKQVIIVVGSPRRKGNSAMLAEQAASGVRSCGAGVETIYLQGLKMELCNACDICQGDIDTDCIIDDELTALLPRLRRADALILASPVYWFTFTAQMKLFIDRDFYALNGPQGHALKGKPIGLIMAYADTDPFTSGAVNAIRTFQDMCRYMDAPVAGMVYGSATNAGDIQNQPELLQEAYQLGQKLGANN